MTPTAKFQQLLHELFQFDLADLNFGIYRIMNHKRGVIDRFIDRDLPKAIEEELRQGALADEAHARQALEAARRKVLEALGEQALDAEGNLAEQFYDTKVGREYLEARAKAVHAKSSEALETAVYNHLYSFFSRYYEDGDFISKRRYSKKERYVIPYNGEEVYLYWANHDQYYVKTAEYFTDYSWKAPNGVTVHFRLKAADVEQNNVKGEKRFFLPVSDGVVWSDAAGSPTLTIPFEYRPLTAQEAVTYGNTGQQDRIIEGALNAVPERLKANPSALAALTAERRKDAQGNPVSFLAHHLRQYTARNTRDFFIHKDLKGFLSRELDFYLKSEVLNLEEMEAAGSALAEGWFQTMRLIKKVGGHIIEFLAQIEEFQKMLWEKKKFVTKTFYCITVGNIPEEFYPEIAENEAQWEEWRALLHVDEGQENLFTVGKAKKEKRLEFLKNHPTLPLDTRRFPPDFTDRLLASFANLDEMTDGLLVHGENWQTLSLLQEKYRERVKCVHIDPPYNTQSSGFLYKNDYQHSSWLAMMQDRLHLSIPLLKNVGVLACHIDEFEMERLQLLLNGLQLSNAGTLIWDKGMPTTGAIGIATQHEYVLFRSPTTDVSMRVQKKNIAAINSTIQRLLKKYGGPTKEAIAEYRRWLRENPLLSKAERTYDQFDETGQAFRSDNMSATDRRRDAKFYVPLKHVITGENCPVPEFGWRYTPESMQKLMDQGLVLFGEDHAAMPRKKTYLIQAPDSQMPSIFKSGSRGKSDLDQYSLEFPFAHSVEFYDYIIENLKCDREVVLDYFAGSGTTGHAVINLNRDDGGRRKFILVEMAQYFDTVLLPRIKKVTFSPEWKDGKPKRMATAEEAERSPRIVKVIRLESYEDALNNIAFDEESGQKALDIFGKEYLLTYMLKWESKNSETLLDVEKLQAPFSYKLHIHRDLSAGQAGGETRERVVDLPETFSYLIGLDVKTRKVYADNGRRYLVCRGTTREGRNVAVIWRDTKDWKQTDYERDEQFVKEQNIAADADEIFVNGDSYIPGAQSLDGLFKARMFADVKG